MRSALNPDIFLSLIDEHLGKQPRPTGLATIDPNYGGTGNPKVQWDGEDVVTSRTYPYLSSYTPTAGDRVLMLRSGSTWVVLGALA